MVLSQRSTSLQKDLFGLFQYFGSRSVAYLHKGVACIDRPRFEAVVNYRPRCGNGSLPHGYVRQDNAVRKDYRMGADPNSPTADRS